jgi:hypothetical protein
VQTHTRTTRHVGLLNHLHQLQIVFSKLGRKEVRIIAGLLLKETVDRVAARG